MLISLYLVTFITSLYFVFKKRYIDIITMAYFIGILYFLPLYFGYVIEPSTKVKINIDDFIYVFLMLMLIGLTLIAYLSDKYSHEMDSIKLKDNASINMLFCIFIIMLLTVVFSSDANLLIKGNKLLLSGANLGKFSEAIWLSMSILAIASFYKKKLYTLIVLLFILLTLYIGTRAYFVTSIIIMLLIYFSQKKIRIITKFKYIFLGGLLFIFVISYKYFWISIRNLDYENFITRINLFPEYFYYMLTAEQNIIVLNFNNVIVSPILLTIDHTYSFFTKLIPLPGIGGIIRDLFGIETIKFSHMLMDSYYPKRQWGAGSTFWGEMFSLGGVSLVFISLLLWLGILYIFNYYFKRYKSFNILLFMPFFVYISFYIHRIELALIPSSIVISMFVFIFVSSLLLVFKRLNIVKIRK